MKKYSIIYADPPWEYKVWTAKGGHKSASAHYNIMHIEDIKNLKISELANENCILFLWATFPNLKEAFEVIDSWGFEYKTCAFVWVKKYSNNDDVVGLGYWTRSNAELCLLATKGKIKRINKNVHQIIYSKLREHSRKPDEARKKIVELIGDLPRIELFARQKVEGWDAWGDEVPSDCQMELR